ncbi:unnamed protein product [Sphagnum jensenii]|uniref:Nucleolar protein 6 n=1 Tax=Sphagnum jensenii TaxID=128206 RepID=A0ABP0WKT6_9BRYO
MADTPLAALKVQELLREVRVDYSKTRVIEAAVAAVVDLLSGLADEEVSPSLASAFARDLGVPEDKARFKFRKPEWVRVVGSYGTHTIAKPVQQVDIAVRIPKSCFHEKDYLNHRYHVKRALYLVVLEKHLCQCSAIKTVDWGSFLEDARKPVLVLQPGPSERGATSKFVICIVPTISEEVFDTDKLVPLRNNVREVKSQEGSALATPHYNSSILEDMVVEHNCAWLQSVFLESEAMRDAVLLLKVWFRQRRMQASADYVNGFLLSMLMAHLLTNSGGKRINLHMTALQIFRVIMDAIVTSSTFEKGVFIQTGEVAGRSAEVRKALLQTFDVVICDSTGLVNLSSRVTKSALAELKEEAVRTLSAMKDRNDEGFDVLFMTQSDYCSKFDYHVRLQATTKEASSLAHCMDMECTRTYEQNVESLLTRGLGDRARIIRVLRRSCPTPWSPDQGLPDARKVTIFAGILLNNLDIALRMADVGPSADNKKEAAKFRAFWGPKSELRRFKDGMITETAVWECEGWQRHLIIQRIVEHVLCRHLSLDVSLIHVVSGQLDFALLENGTDTTTSTPKLLEALDILSKRLRTIENLPLQVVSVQPVSAAFRSTDVFPPLPHPLAAEADTQKIPSKPVASHVDPLNILLQLEGSGKWPDDPIGIAKTKSAFCLEIARSMQEKWGVGCIATEDAVDILMEGYTFRLSVLYSKDLGQPDKSVGELLPSRTEGLMQDGHLQNAHASLLQALHGACPAYGPTVRLAKRWMWSHLFSGVISDEVVELLVAYTFVKSAPNAPPSSRLTGFLRFLLLLVHYDWALAPLVVDVNGDFTTADLDRIVSQFESVRRKFQGGEGGGPAMYISTPYDSVSKTWTQHSPSPAVLKRLIAYAKSSADLIVSLIKGEEDDSRWLSVFRTPLTCYDALILFHPEALPHPSRTLFQPEVHSKAVIKRAPVEGISPWVSQNVLRRGIRTAREHLLIGFNPVLEFAEELQVKYGKVCSLWYDAAGSSGIMGLTFSNSAHVTKAKSAKRKQVENGQAIIDLDSFVRDVADIGEGLVKSIHILSR